MKSIFLSNEETLYDLGYGAKKFMQILPLATQTKIKENVVTFICKTEWMTSSLKFQQDPSQKKKKGQENDNESQGAACSEKEQQLGELAFGKQ